MKSYFGFGLRLAVAGLALVLVSSPAPAQEFDKSQKAEIEKIIGEYLEKNPGFVREYLLENPEILLEVSSKLREQQGERERAQVAMAMAAHKDLLERHPMTPVSGNPDGDITLIEFFDYNCSFCKRAFSYMRDIEESDPNLRVAWKEYPILTSRTPTSLTAAQVAMAADLQGKYMETHKALMGVPGTLTSDAQIFRIAEELGLDMERLVTDMKSPRIKGYITETVRMGETLQLNGTPSFVINETIIGGAVPKEVILATIAAARAGALKPGQLSEEDLGRILQKFGS